MVRLVVSDEVKKQVDETWVKDLLFSLEEELLKMEMGEEMFVEIEMENCGFWVHRTQEGWMVKKYLPLI
ncbi:hypothetical protein [Geobacillus subterraneus]|uniref:hypothetical protein n=1 Tax=Geobacillus subterraneus TaxID=129338 RepID=UPI00155321EA|nr:hypothetical protein [Geobacillus subterraneus]